MARMSNINLKEILSIQGRNVFLSCSAHSICSLGVLQRSFHLLCVVLCTLLGLLGGKEDSKYCRIREGQLFKQQCHLKSSALLLDSSERQSTFEVKNSREKNLVCRSPGSWSGWTWPDGPDPAAPSPRRCPNETLSKKKLNRD